MAGTIEGGNKAAQTNKAKHGSDFYREIGRKGGVAKRPTKGFGYFTKCNCNEFDYEHNLQQCAGKKGGRASVKGKMKQVSPERNLLKRLFGGSHETR